MRFVSNRAKNISTNMVLLSTSFKPNTITNRNRKFRAQENSLGSGLNMRTPSQNTKTKNKQSVLATKFNISYHHVIQFCSSSLIPTTKKVANTENNMVVLIYITFLPFWDPWMTHHPFTPMPTEAPPFAAPSAPAFWWSSVAGEKRVRGWRRRCDLWVFPRRGSGYWLIG